MTLDPSGWRAQWVAALAGIVATVLWSARSRTWFAVRLNSSSKKDT